MATTLKQQIVATAQSLMTTELNALANGGTATVTATFDNTIAAAGDGSLFWEVELNVNGALGAAPTGGYGASVWFLHQPDGTNLEATTTSSATVPPVGRGADVTFNFNAIVAPGRMTMVINAPPGVTKAILWNNGGGQALPATGNTLKIRPFTYQSI